MTPRINLFIKFSSWGFTLPPDARSFTRFRDSAQENSPRLAEIDPL